MTTLNPGEQPAPSTTPPPQTRLGITLRGSLNSLRSSVLFRHLLGKLRRQWLVTFRPGYVRRQLALRQGDCRQCGICCALGHTCPLLHNPTRHCLIYYGYRPKSCCVFPVDERDLQDVQAAGGTCGYAFPAKAAK